MGTPRSTQDHDDLIRASETRIRHTERTVSGHTYDNVTARERASIHNGDRFYHFYSSSTPRLREETEEEDRLKKLLDALAFPQMGFRAMSISDAYQSTCQWFFKTPEYTRWRDWSFKKIHHGLLWVKGKPGSGKSTITKCAVEHARASHGEETTIFFFFNARGEHLEKSTEGMFRCLLHQMVQYSPCLMQSLDVEAITASAQKEWPSDLLRSLFREAVCEFGSKHQLCCYIDALDEGDEDEIRDMVSFLEELLEHTLENDISFSVYLASRHYPNVSVSHSENFLLDNHQGHDTDISTYVLDKLRCKPASLKEDLVTTIIRRSSGIFLWVVLVVKDLNKESDRGNQLRLRSRLQETPSGLKELFQRTMQETSTDVYMLPALQIVLFACRALRPMELYFAITTSIDPGLRTSAIWDTALVDETSAENFIVYASKGMLEIVHEDRDATHQASYGFGRWQNSPNVQFIHESVREYLMSFGMRLLDPTLGTKMIGECHLRITQWCRSYLETGFKYIPARQLNSNDRFANEDLGVLASLPFLRYALHGCLCHGETAARNGMPVPVSNAFFLQYHRRIYWSERDDLPKFHGSFPSPSVGATWRDQLVSRDYFAPTTLHILASERCPALIQQHISSLANWHPVQRQRYIDQHVSASDMHGTALQIVVARRFFDVTDLLLKLGANANAFMDGYSGAQPSLHIAARHDRIRWRSPPNVEIANVKMIKLLLQYGADVNISTRQWGSPLFFAVHETRASVEVVETLIKCGADLHTRGALGETVLQRAIEQNRTDLVDLLIRYGICVGIRDHAGRTPLHAAVDLLYEKDYTFDVSLLRYTRGPIGDIPGQRRAPFRPRNYNGFPLASIKSLLQHGANTNVLSADGLTPLQIVAGFPHLKSNATPLILIKTLLRHGADINAHDTRHNTPLRLAVSVGNIRVAMALLAYGANIECPARQLEGYKTAIDLAKESEFRTKELRQLIVQMLAYIANFPLDARLEAAYAPGTKGWWEQLLNEEKFLDRPYLRHIFTRTPRTQPPPRTQMLVCVQWRASSESESPRHPRPGMDVSDLDSDSSGEQDTVQE